MTGFIGQDYGIYLEEDFFFPSSAGYGCSAGSLMRMVKACGGHAMALAAALWNVS